MPEVEQLCSTVLILDSGRVVVSGTVAEVIRVVPAQAVGQLKVPVEFVEIARRALAGVPGLVITHSEEHADVLSFTLDRHERHDDTSPGMNAALRAVLSADVPVLSFEIDGMRLTDAFLAITRKDIQ